MIAPGGLAARAKMASLAGMVLSRLVLFTAGVALLPGLALAQSPPDAHEAKPAPYDARLMRLAEILGSVTYLRTLCGDAEASEWRSKMQALIEREAGAEADRKARLTAGYNRGFRSFAAVYQTCTPSAVLADRRYRDEGATLAAEIVSRFGN